MKKQSPNLEVEGTQPDYVRELLEAGRGDAAARGYDVDAGLARHIAQVQAGAPLPPWAHELMAAAGGGAVGAAGATAAKVATGKLVAGVVLAVVTAGTIAAVVIGAPEKSTHISPPSNPAQVAPAGAPTGTDGIQPGGQEPASDEMSDAVELEFAPITSSRPKRAGHAAQSGREAEVESKQAPSRTQSAKTLDALIEAVGKQGGSSTRPASQGPVELVAPSTGAERTRAKASESSEASEPSARSEQTTAAHAPAPVVDDARLEREMGMLAVAQKVLKTDPERALRLARQGEQEFAGSMFTQERQQVLLLALIELGRIPEAKRLALPYLKRYPNGPFSDRLRSALAAAKPEN